MTATKVVALMLFSAASGAFFGHWLNSQLRSARVVSDASIALEFGDRLKSELERIDRTHGFLPDDASGFPEIVTAHHWYQSNRDRVLYFKCGESAIAKIIRLDGRVLTIAKDRPLNIE